MKLFTLKNKRHMPKFLAYMAVGIIRLIALTYRVTIDESRGRLEALAEGPRVNIIWHNRLLFYSCFVPRRLLKTCAVLISSSRDGEYIASIIRLFGLHVVRGSSSRGAAKALMDLRDIVKTGLSIALTVDGPRGPRYTVHAGAFDIASHENVPLMPFSLNARHKWQLKSWDGLQIPVPFSKVTFVVGEPFRVPEGLTQQEACAYIGEKLMEITED